MVEFLFHVILLSCRNEVTSNPLGFLIMLAFIMETRAGKNCVYAGFWSHRRKRLVLYNLGLGSINSTVNSISFNIIVHAKVIAIDVGLKLKHPTWQETRCRQDIGLVRLLKPLY